MSEPVDPIRRLGRVQRVRRGAEALGRTSGSAEPSRALTAAGPPRTHEPEPKAPQGDAAFAAQLLAGAPARGLKGGAETLQQARSTYLHTEYSGAADRRRKKGREAKTDV